MSSKVILIGAFVVLGVGTLTYLQLSHVRNIKRERAILLDQIKHLFTEVKLHQDGINYPTLTGIYRGRPIKLEPIVDTLAFRKLPVLWLLVTHYRPLGVAAPLDILLRPLGTEFFSPNSDFEHDIAPEADWPEHIRIASPNPSEAPSISVFRPFIRFITDPPTKEVLVTSKGVRLVRQIAEGSQAHYRVTRRTELGAIELTPAQLGPVLDALLEMGDTLAARSKT